MTSSNSQRYHEMLFLLKYKLLDFSGASLPSYISTFICGIISEHLPVVQNNNKSKKKVCVFHNIFSRIFKILQKILKFWSFINLPWGHVRSHTKFGPDRSSRFDVYWIQTNRQTDKQRLYIEDKCCWWLFYFHVTT